MTTLALALAAYAALVLAIGAAATRTASRDPAEYFLAGRGLGPLVLFMALFGTNCTAFVLIGVPGQAYRDGIAIFGANAPIIALGVPLTFWCIGLPARRLGQQLGALTPAELYAKQPGSPAVGAALCAVFTLYTLPYMVTAVQGAAVALATATEGALPEWLGVLGALEFPSLAGHERDRIFSLVAAEHLPGGLEVLARIAVLAAVMSTLDAQQLTLGSMLTRDVLDRCSPARSARAGGLGAALSPSWAGFLPVSYGFAAALAGAVLGSWGARVTPDPRPCPSVQRA